MAEIVKVVQHREGEGFQCQLCGTAWIPRVKGKLPRRCPNQECRTMRWDRTRYPNAAPPDNPGPNGGARRFDALPVIGHPPAIRRPPLHAVVTNPRSPHDALAA